jgi:hypothetical protein
MGGGLYRAWVTGDLSSTKELRITAGENATLTLVTDAVATITGQIVDGNGAPIGGATVALIPEGALALYRLERSKLVTIKTRTDAIGRFTFTRAPCQALHIVAAASGFAERSMSIGEPAPRETRVLEPLALAPVGKTRLTVVDDKGNAINGAKAWVNDATGASRVLGVEFTAPRGSNVIEIDAEAGAVIEVFASGYQQAIHKVPATLSADGVAETEVVLYRGVRLTVRVRDGRRSAADGAELTLINANGYRVASGDPRGRPPGAAPRLEKGLAVFSGVPPGIYTLKVRARGYEWHFEAVEVGTSNKRVTVNIDQ